MTEDLHPIDDLFRSGLEGKEDTPAPEVWKNIEKELEGKDRRPVAGYFWRSRKAAAILLALVGAAGIFAAGYYIRGVNISDNNKKPSIEIQKGSKQPDSIANAELSLNGVENKALDHSGNAIANQTPDKPASAYNSDVDAVPAAQDAKKGTGVERAVPISEVNSPAGSTTLSGNPSGKNKGSQDQSLTRASTGTDKSGAATSVNGTTSNQHSASSTHNSSDLGVSSDIRTSKGKDLSSKKNRTNTSAELNDAPANAPTTIKQEEVNRSYTTNELSQPVDETSVMQHDVASIDERAMNKDLPSTEKKIGTSSNALPKAFASPSSSKNIPVKNKRDGDLDLPRFSITPVVAVQSGNTKITEKDDVWNSAKVKADMERTEHEPVTISAGILADIRISRNLTLQSGLILQQHNIHIDPKTVWAAKSPDGKMKYKFDCTAGTYYISPKQGTYLRPGDTATTSYSTNELNYLNIPLALKWNFGSSKLQFFAIAGGGINLLTRHDLETGLAHVYNYEQEALVTNLRSSYFNGMIGAGVNWRFSNKFSLNVNPQYQFALTPMNENMPVNALPRTFSMQMGLQIKLR